MKPGRAEDRNATPPTASQLWASRHRGDAELLRAIAGKDRAAFEELYHRYHRRLHGFLLRWLRDPQILEEVLNDSFFAVWTRARSFESRARVSTWIFGIAYRQAMKAVGRTLRRAGEVSHEQAPEPVDQGLGARARELRLSLDKALAELSDDHRAVVELTYWEDCTYAEIAEIVQVPVNTVKTRMFYARRHLRQLLPNYGFTHG